MFISLILLFGSFVLSSCSPQKVLVVSDPYIRLIQKKSWAPESMLFRLEARMKGFRITAVTTDGERNLNTVISEQEEVSGIVILSPWNAQFLNEIPEVQSRFIIAGGYPPEKVPPWLQHNLTALVPDRLHLIEELGEIASGYAEKTSLPALALFLTEAESRKKELNVLIEAFDNPDLLIVKEINASGDHQLPPDFNQISGEASILLLFAGVLNIDALTVSDEYLPPVITESIRDSGAWKSRIAASTEDNSRALRSFLLSEMKSPTGEELIYYPAELSKGVLFGSVSR